jgi:hypothetical protein
LLQAHIKTDEHVARRKWSGQSIRWFNRVPRQEDNYGGSDLLLVETIDTLKCEHFCFAIERSYSQSC